MRVGTVANGAESSLCLQKLSLGFPSGELAVGQHHRSVGDPQSACGGGRVFEETARGLERASSLLESTLGVLCVVPCLEVRKTALKLSRTPVPPRARGHIQARADGQKAY